VKLAAVLAVLLAASVAEACQPPVPFTPRHRLEAPGVVVAFSTLPPKIVVGRHFSVEAYLCADEGSVSLTRVDATMPEHRHGMNYRTRLAVKQAGQYLAEGFLFHMPGTWQFVFDVEHQGKRLRLTSDVLIE
jgi:hypothetical protein